MVSEEPDSRNPLSFSPEPGGQSRTEWPKMPGQGCAGELEAMLEECGWSEFKGMMGWEAGRTTFNVSDCILSLDIQKVPLVCGNGLYSLESSKSRSLGGC